jgi:hypothetical protein
MGLGFAPGKKSGQHYQLAMYAIKKASKVNLLLKGQTEKNFEYSIVSHLQSSRRLRKNLITQIGVDEVQKMTKASLFGFSHWPDISIGNSGTAIEIKVVTGGPGMRDLIGQAIAYRMHYRFVMLVVVDQTADFQIVALCKNKQSQEYQLLSGLARDANIYTIVGPDGPCKNIVFSGRERAKKIKPRVPDVIGNPAPPAPPQVQKT